MKLNINELIQTFGILAILGSSLLNLSCKRKETIFRNNLGYIVGPTNDISVFDSNDPRLGLYDFSFSSVLVTTTLADGRVKFCSGTLVAPSPGEQNLRVLTNHHCFAQTDQEGKATQTLLAEACTRTKIYLEFVTGKTLGAISKICTPQSLRTNFDMDLAVFTLDGSLPPKYKPLPVYRGEVEQLKGKSVVVVHYPDLNATRKSPGQGVPELPVAAYTNNDCRILGTFTEQEIVLDRTLPFGLRHTCDLIHGSSGSALLDSVSGMIYGVNWGGIQINSGNGIITDNVATSAAFVLAFLEGTSQGLVFNKAGSINGAGGPQSRSGADVTGQKTEDSGSKDHTKSKKGCGVVSTLEFRGFPDLGPGLLSFLMGWGWLLAGLAVPVLQVAATKRRA